MKTFDGEKWTGELSKSEILPDNSISKAPVVLEETTLITDPDGRMVDGARFFTVIEVKNLPGTWLDNWYGYVAGHDSPGIHLVTAPNFYGPWTIRDEVISVPSSNGIMKDSTHQVHVSSPDVYYNNGKIHLLYHGPLATNLLEQPTSLATSPDGRIFTRVGNVLPTDYSNFASPYRTSTSYTRTYLDGGTRHAIWQGTTGKDSEADGYSYVPFPMGHATSVDGVNYQILRPILTSGHKNQGLMAPGITKIGDQWVVVGVFREFNGTSGQIETTRMYVGKSLDDLQSIGKITLGGSQVLTSPTIFVRDGVMYLFGGNRPTNGTASIVLFKLGWK